MSSYSYTSSDLNNCDYDFVLSEWLSFLQNFLLRVGSHCVLSQDKMFHGFLKQDDAWKETVYATDFQSKV